ncbi:MAG TPA: molybdenum cofactor biosynthesis protein MoaE [Verrucomicrobiales bacterium]|mgnify:FL=1|nr:molybdenum cofactor biosynthesis protein MoaE [Verrucomicrobiales bacterium]|tara:strand:- start:158 stop:550 length:393 start_codon:yes stop_codon:yes gene_type:complete
MKAELTLSPDPIDEAALAKARSITDGMGAVVTFAGVVRGREGEVAITGIDYESFDDMARRQFELIFAEIEQRWPIESVRLAHRTGIVKVNEPSLWVEVVAAHRAEAFYACQFLIDQMKQRVPIWKKPIVT